jgi:HD superfamily phosphohydrolase
MCASIHDVLTERFTCPIRDVLWGHIYLTPELAALFDSAPFIRLHRILQLGPVYRVYPGASHSRAGHSIGVYHLGRRLLQNLAERGAADWISREGALSFLCACLLHDLGHFPYTHSLKELSLRSHESLTGAIILAEPMKSLVGACGADPTLTAAIVDESFLAAEAHGEYGNKGNNELLFYRKLLSGCLDPDKLDYLNRDARYCGVPYGALDVDFIFSRLIPSFERGTDIDSRLIPNVEAILFAKYLMFRTVYWHRQVRAATSMIKKALLEGLESGKFAGEELYDLDDQGLFALLREKTASPLAEAVWNGKLYSVAAEIPYIKADHACLLDIKKRSHHEKQLADEFRSTGIPLGLDDLIIDLPESVSFEADLFVLDEKCNFADSSSAFKTETLNSFVNTLYTVRIFVNPEFCEKIETLPELSDILNIQKVWLGP